MYFDIKTGFLMALAATQVVSAAIPNPSPSETTTAVDGFETIVKRAKVPDNGVKCPDGTTFTADQIKAAVSASHHEVNGYPHEINNKQGNNKILPNAGDKIYEFPIVKGGAAYTGQPEQKYRVATNAKYVYSGVLQHTGGNGFTECKSA